MKGALLALLCGAALAACASAPPIPDAAPCRRVWVYWADPNNNHTSLLIPRADFPVPGVFAAAPDPDGQRRLVSEKHLNRPIITDWVEVGFASSSYLEDRVHGKYPNLWSILLHGTPGALVVRPFPMGRNPEDWHGTEQYLYPVDLPEARYRALLDFVAGSFALRDGAPQSLVENAQLGIVYLSRYGYSYRRFCNVWALDALRVAGVRVSGWMPESFQVRYWLENHYRPARFCAAAAQDVAGAPPQD